MKRKRESATEEMVEELKRAAREVGFDVREEELLREAGYRAHSGTCRLGDRSVILLDRSLPAAERVEVLCAALAGWDLEGIFLSPALRARLSRSHPPAAPIA